MFTKKNHTQENNILPKLLPLMGNAEFDAELAGQGLKKAFELVGADVDCVVLVNLVNREDYLFSTLPEDEARYYGKPGGTCLPEDRVEGKKSLYFPLEIKEILTGLWVFEIPVQAAPENLSEYEDMVSVMKGFLYSCFLSEAYKEQKNRDSFTNLPGIVSFDQDVHNALKKKEQGFLLVGRCPPAFSGSCQKNGLNHFIINMAETCRDLHPERLYRIGPDMVAMICTEEKDEVFSLLQELLHVLSDHTFFLAPLTVLNRDNIYGRIQEEMEQCDGRQFVSGCDGIYPKLTAFQEECS